MTMISSSKHGYGLASHSPDQPVRSTDSFMEKIVRTTLFRALVIGASIYAAPAFAQGSDSMFVNSQVQPFCSELAVNPAPMNLGNLTGATGQIVADFSGAVEANRELAASFYCNAPSKVTITAEPLRHDTVNIVTDASSFTNRVDYTASLEWDDVTGSVSSTSDSGQEIIAPQANIGPMTLRLTDPSVTGNLRPIAGDYNGQIRLTVSLSQ